MLDMFISSISLLLKELNMMHYDVKDSIYSNSNTFTGDDCIYTERRSVFIPYFLPDIISLPRFTQPKIDHVYLPKVQKQQYIPIVAVPRRMLRCQRKGIGLRIKIAN